MMVYAVPMLSLKYGMFFDYIPVIFTLIFNFSIALILFSDYKKKNPEHRFFAFISVLSVVMGVMFFFILILYKEVKKLDLK